MKLNLIKIFIIVFFIANFKIISAQNLVPNGSFEKHFKCPSMTASLEDTVIYNWLWDWGSPDYFCSCATNYLIYGSYWVDVPLNYAGFQYARTGECYAGFALNGTNTLCEITENIKVELKQTLIIHKKYCFSAYLSLSDGSTYSIDGIDVYLSNDNSLIPYHINPCTFNISPQISQRGHGVIDDTLNWVKIKGEYISNGSENHLFIGKYSALSINGIKKNNFIPMNFPWWGLASVYYYIDDVALWPCDTTPPQCDAGKDKTICWGDSVLIGTHNYSDYYYQWKEGINSNFNNQYDSGAIWVSPKYTTTYVLETTDFRYEKSYDTVTVDLCNLKAKEYFVCLGDSLLLNNSIQDSLKHLWKSNVFLNSSSIQSPMCTPTTDVAYIHYIMNSSNTVIGQDTILVKVMDCSPARSDTTICLGDDIYLGNSNYTFTSYIWQPLNYLDNNLISNPLARPPKNITYYVIALDSNGVAHQDSVNINVKPCNLPPEIVVPNIFTPNADGINDIFKYKNEEFWQVQTQIFNRWGQLLFDGKNEERWDGTYQGKKVSEGVYFFHITAKAEGFEKLFEYHGSITVIYN
ncbi:MAG: hypothetical protein AUJ98_06785 [Bacteroidetes bacterium CG2_30_33_31]|nr:MAG: hypothetical protein AUJ98_06785 [Bacteroidetes bacterium CG2_30_33_31]